MRKKTQVMIDSEYEDAPEDIERALDASVRIYDLLPAPKDLVFKKMDVD